MPATTPRLDYATAKAQGEALEARHKELAADQNRIRTRLLGGVVPPMNLTPDAVRLAPEYRAAKAASDAAWERVRGFNATFSRVYKAEIAADRDNRRRAILKAAQDSGRMEIVMVGFKPK